MKRRRRRRRRNMLLRSGFYFVLFLFRVLLQTLGLAGLLGTLLG